MTVERKEDAKRRNGYMDDVAFTRQIREEVETRYGKAVSWLKPDASWPRRYFTPVPHVWQMIDPPDVVICPRRRAYGSGKNWPHWEPLRAALEDSGLTAFSGGAQDSSDLSVGGPHAWNYDRPLDATIEAMLSARLVVATDAGLAHLAVLCGRPLLMITWNGLVAPGPVTNEDGKVFEPRYWPPKMERYEAANHTGSMISVMHDVWDDPAKLVIDVHSYLRALV